nr:uncharacterized protein LOC115269921 [Aedes albopictus]
MPANQVSTPNCGPGSPVASPLASSTPSWANDSLNCGMANWINSIINTMSDTPNKSPTNLDTDSDCIMIVDEEKTSKPETPESKSPVHSMVPPVKSKPATTESKSLVYSMSMLLSTYDLESPKNQLPKINKDRLSLRAKARIQPGQPAGPKSQKPPLAVGKKAQPIKR